jgi:hypothetical protein
MTLRQKLITMLAYFVDYKSFKEIYTELGKANNALKQLVNMTPHLSAEDKSIKALISICSKDAIAKYPATNIQTQEILEKCSNIATKLEDTLKNIKMDVYALKFCDFLHSYTPFAYILSVELCMDAALDCVAQHLQGANLLNDMTDLHQEFMGLIAQDSSSASSEL